MPSVPSADRNRCWPTCRATRTALPSRTVGWWVGRDWRDIQMEGLSPRRPGSLQDDHAGSRRVYPPVPDARAPKALPPHSPLRSIREWWARREHCAGPRAVEDGGCRQSASLQHRRSGALTSLPVLRRAHVHHREVRARNHTSHSAVDTDPCDRVRQLMITGDTSRCNVARPCCWLPSGHANVRALYRQGWRFLSQSSLLYPSRDGPSASTVSPSSTDHCPPDHQPTMMTACVALESP